MALNPMKTSRHSGNSIDLYEFTYGENPADVFRYCSGERPVVLDGETYTPLAIERDAIKSKGREMGGSFNVTVPRTSDIAKLFQGTPPRRVIFLRIFEGDLPEFDSPVEYGTDPVANVIWTGRVLEAQNKETTTILSCDNLGAGMKRPGLHRFYQRECPFALFGSRCQASKVAASTTVEVFAADPVGRRIGVNWTLLGFTEEQKENHIGGLVEFTGPNGLESRVIVAVGSTYLDVDSPVTGLISEFETFTITLGCQRTPDACSILHNNIVNFGGMPWIPNHDPHNKNNHT